MFAHADETDDFEPVTKAHPGCAVVPAALAIGEREGRSGTELLRAVALGYDLCCRWLLALGPEPRARHASQRRGRELDDGRSGGGGVDGRLDEKGMRYALSYAVQQVSGIWSWERDLEHVEKAFDFAGMGARNGVTAAVMAQAGFTGVRGRARRRAQRARGAFHAAAAPRKWRRISARRFYVTETAIKTFSVGYPIQSALDAFLSLRREHSMTSANRRAHRRHAARRRRRHRQRPRDAGRQPAVSDRGGPDRRHRVVRCQPLVRPDEGSAVLAVKRRVELVADRALMDPAAPRSARVEVRLRDGRDGEPFTRHAPGTKENPLDTAAVNAKARGLIAPVLGASRTEKIIERVNSLERLSNVRELVGLLRGAA